MDSRKPKTWLTVALVTVCLLAVPTVVSSQCKVTGPAMILMGATTTRVAKNLSSLAKCKLTAQNASVCSPAAGRALSTNYLLAVAMSTTVSPYCHWDCTCDTGTPPDVVIDGSDGLPVELMDFAVGD